MRNDYREALYHDDPRPHSHVAGKVIYSDEGGPAPTSAPTTGGFGNYGGASGSTQTTFGDYTDTELRQLWRGEQITEDQWVQELIDRGNSESAARNQIARQKTIGISTAKSTAGQLTPSEQNAVNALKAGAPPRDVPGALNGNAAQFYEPIGPALPGASSPTLTGRANVIPESAGGPAQGGGSTTDGGGPPVPQRKYPNLSVADLFTFYGQGNISEADLTAELKAIGFNAEEQKLLFIKYAPEAKPLTALDYSQANANQLMGLRDRFTSGDFGPNVQKFGSLGVELPTTGVNAQGQQEGFTFGYKSPKGGTPDAGVPFMAGAWLPEGQGQSSQYMTGQNVADILRARGIQATGDLVTDLETLGTVNYLGDTIRGWNPNLAPGQEYQQVVSNLTAGTNRQTVPSGTIGALDNPLNLIDINDYLKTPPALKKSATSYAQGGTAIINQGPERIYGGTPPPLTEPPPEVYGGGRERRYELTQIDKHRAAEAEAARRGRYEQAYWNWQGRNSPPAFPSYLDWGGQSYQHGQGGPSTGGGIDQVLLRAILAGQGQPSGLSNLGNDVGVMTDTGMFYDPSLGARGFANLEASRTNSPYRFAGGGSMVTDEPIIGVGQNSGQPRFQLGEAGAELMSVTPLGGGNTPPVDRAALIKALAAQTRKRIKVALPGSAD